MSVTKSENDRLNRRILNAANGDIDLVFQAIKNIRNDKQKPTPPLEKDVIEEINNLKSN